MYKLRTEAVRGCASIIPLADSTDEVSHGLSRVVPSWISAANICRIDLVQGLSILGLTFRSILVVLECWAARILGAGKYQVNFKLSHILCGLAGPTLDG